MTSDDHKKEIDEISGIETTGHEWDGLKELNNPLPRWWLWVWAVCTIWAAWYWVVYPAWPTLTGNTQGSAGWTQHKKLADEQAEIFARKGAYLDKFRGASFEQIQADPELYKFAQAGGKIAFKDNCATCHGSGGAGADGYPNLNDDDWIWGGSMEDIHTTIQHGIRAGNDDTRDSIMSAFGADELLEAEEIASVADYVLSLSGNGTASEAGATIYAENCAACHGDAGEGGRDFGAPNLKDAIWLYDGSRDGMIAQISTPRHGVMPAWAGRLSDEKIRMLTLYVHSLGGGE